MERTDDFLKRREHLANLTDEELKQRFWELAEKVTAPLLELGYKNTSPSIERSVLLRMGFSSLEAKNIVDKCINHGLLPKGAGHVVYRLAKGKGIEIRDAGLLLEKGECWDEMQKIFGAVK